MVYRLFTKIFFLTLLFLIMLSDTSLSQEREYKQFKHPNGIVSAEGYMQEGIPVGYWKSYYPDGTLKSEGIRKESEPDSLWKFYDREGYLRQKISYKKGVRNGYTENYAFKNDTSRQRCLVSKILFIDGKKNGEAEFYRPNGTLLKTVEYEDGYKNGYERIFNSEGRIITLIRYSYDNIVETENINRTDRHGQKQGIWKTFHPNDQVKTFASYLDGKLHGYYREYNMKGKLIANEYYINGKKQNLQAESSQENAAPSVVYKKQFYDNGTIKSEGPYRDTLAVGMHRLYNRDGRFDKAVEYDEKGFTAAEGRLNEAGERVGEWKEFYAVGSLKAKGEYRNDLRHGPWEFYFPGGGLEQKGNYIKGKPNGHWKWFFPNKKLRRSGVFKNGYENGEFTEFRQNEDTLSHGYYWEGYKEGIWTGRINDRLFEYQYTYGQKDGPAKEFFPDSTLAFEGQYVSGLLDGEHKYYHPNGKLRLKAEYFSGQRHGKWYRYNSAGQLITIVEYENGKKVKIDGSKLVLE